MKPTSLPAAFLVGALSLLAAGAATAQTESPDPGKVTKKQLKDIIGGSANDKGAVPGKVVDSPTGAEPNEQGNDDHGTTQCDFTEASFKDNYKKVAVGGWKVFLNRRDASNAFHLCLNGDQTIFVQGIPAGKSAVRSDGDHLVVETIAADKFIPADDVVEGRLDGSRFLTKSGAHDVIGRFVYYIANADRDHAALKGLAVSGGNTAYADKAAWVRFYIDPRSRDATQMEIHLRAIDGEAAAKLVDKAFKIGGAAKSTFNNEADRKKIAAFVKDEVVRFKGKGTSSTNPNVTIALSVNREIVDVKIPAAVVSIATNGDDTGAKLVNGDPDVRLYAHESLVWCSYPDQRNPGKPYGLETEAQHKAHAK
ncbi:MAG: hypothetical protein HY077_15480 [Elusimicrobia bacterium]|nr:hypothetical protein [Elusimicrobiota bacterium]